MTLTTRTASMFSALRAARTGFTPIVRHASSYAQRRVPAPQGTHLAFCLHLLGDISTPKAFLEAISRPRRDLANNSTCVSALGEDWNEMFALTSEKLKGAGVAVKERKYILWALEKFRQGQDPAKFAYDVKEPKKVRGWGPRVQKGYRVRGMLRHGEKKL